MKEGTDIRGEQFGMLTALRPVERGDRGIVWLLKCNCGGLAFRTVKYLTQARKKGADSACLECCKEAFRGYKDWRRRLWLEKISIRISLGYGLWTDFDNRSLTDQIRNLVAEDLGFLPDDEETEVSSTEPWIDPSYFDWNPDIEWLNGPGERCVSLVDIPFRDVSNVETTNSVILAALERARAMQTSQEDRARAIRFACQFSQYGGDSQFVSLNALCLRWQCALKTIEGFVNEGLPTMSHLVRKRSEIGFGYTQELGTLVPKADHWLVSLGAAA